MKDSTVKLSGQVKDRFLERFFAEETGLDADARRRLVLKSQSVFTSLRVRKAVLARQRGVAKPAKVAAPPRPVNATFNEKPAPVAADPVPAAEAPFDAYLFGLVPVFQREGSDGLLAKLRGVTAIEHLRQMAKAQQIVLTAELRTGDASADAIRSGIVDAVAKRIKDRRAAAG